MFESIEIKRLLKLGQVLLAILIIFLAAETLYAFKSYSNIDRGTPISNVITVSGDGEVFALPDIATFTFGSVENAKTVAEAQKKATEKINKALALVKAAGVEDKDIKTVDYNIYPRYEYQNFPCTQFQCPPSKQYLNGYEVTQTISVKVRKVEDAPKILESLGGVEVTNLSGLEFSVDDQKKLEAEARSKAIASAQEKAKVLVRDLGVRLGRVVNFSESGNYPIAYREGYGMGGDGISVSAPAPKVELPAGQNKITSNVSITYEIR